MLTLRRVLQRRRDLLQVVKEIVSNTDICGKQQAYGPCAVLQEICTDLGWKLAGSLAIERSDGGITHFVEGEDALFQHVPRED